MKFQVLYFYNLQKTEQNYPYSMYGIAAAVITKGQESCGSYRQISFST